MRYSIIIPVAKKDSRFVKRCLLSLLDQDCQDWEAIVVSDNFDLDMKVTDDRVKVYKHTGKKNASAVRNYGAGKAKGEILTYSSILFEVVV